ncbi:MAG TPA: FixG Ig-like domain-containing protein, partial [Gammaproteobacteria bacterium]|nr:FixG Ig-like domain-containing protein [Gammaproteobacteria bacterium]
RGLIRYTSEKEQEGEKTRIIKPKTIGYGVMLAAIISLLSFSIVTRAPLDMAVYQVRNPLYVLLSDGSIQNSYEVKLNNKTEHSLDLTISVYGLPGAAVDLGRLHAIHLAPEQSLRVMARVRLHPTAREDKPKTFHFKVSAEDGSIAPLTQPVLFYMPKHEESTEDSE